MENPIVPCKRKHIQAVSEYCLDNKVEFTIRPGKGNDEFETEFAITDIPRAVALGMFLRENRLFLKGMEPQTNTRARRGEKEKSAPSTGQEEEPAFELQENGLRFDLPEEN